MPELSRFYGIIIRMYTEAGGQHHVPHFHACYGDEVGIFDLNTLEMIAGALSRRQQRLVEAWAELHQAELWEDWQRLQNGRQTTPIAPLSWGFFMHPIYRVTSFVNIAPYVLRVGFDDGNEQTIDFEPILHGDIFGALRDSSLFEQVQIDPKVHTLVWPNGADFDPATLHDWPQNREAFIELAQRWAKVAA